MALYQDLPVFRDVYALTGKGRGPFFSGAFVAGVRSDGSGFWSTYCFFV